MICSCLLSGSMVAGPCISMSIATLCLPVDAQYFEPEGFILKYSQLETPKTL